jgi:hypothetical protein
VPNSQRPYSPLPPRPQYPQMKNIMDAPHGMNIVVECNDGVIYIGRFDESNGFEVLMHDCDKYDPASGGDAEHWKRETATYGVDVKERDMRFPTSDVTTWQPLGQIEKLS